MASLDSIVLRDGSSVPWLGYGTGTALRGKDVTKDVLLAIKCGFRHLDGAQYYENEESFGKAIRDSGIPRSEFYITSKLYLLEGEQSATDTLKESLRKLQLDYIDLFLVHDPLPHAERLKEVWRMMVDAKKAGLTKSIGVSNFNIKQLEEILSTNTEVPVVNQIEFHLFLFDKMKPLLEYHKKHGIITASYGGLSPILPNRGGAAGIEHNRQALSEVLDKVRTSRGRPVTQSQIIMKWLRQKGILTVTTSSKEERIKEYLQTQDVAPLSDEEIKEIETSVSGARFRFFTNVHMDDLSFPWC